MRGDHLSNVFHFIEYLFISIPTDLGCGATGESSWLFPLLPSVFATDFILFTCVNVWRSRNEDSLPSPECI